ncbi:UNVERIFIED_CONTAM: hypothetical protein FKN15_066910 [Acipenser sinensis]
MGAIWEGDDTGRERGKSPQAEEKMEDNAGLLPCHSAIWEGDNTGRERGESPQAEEKMEDKMMEMAGWQTALQAEGHCIITVEEEEETAGTSSRTEEHKCASNRK